MSTLASTLEQFRTSFPASQLFPNLCDIKELGGSTADGFGGTTETDSTLASNVPCKYEPLSSAVQRQIGGGPITTLTHKLILPATAVTKVIRSHYKIVVQALNGQPELTFRNPVTLDGSFSVFVKLAAELAE